MRIPHIILTIIEYNKGSFTGKTLLQKAIFFLNELADLKINFKPHYYGPYSSDVAVALENLVGLGFLREIEERFHSNWDVWGEVKRYTFELTDEGKEIVEEIKQSPIDKADYKKIRTILQKLGRFAESKDYDQLSKAAKILHIVKSNRRITKTGIKREASTLGWRLSSDEINKMAAFLNKLGLVSTH